MGGARISRDAVVSFVIAIIWLVTASSIVCATMLAGGTNGGGIIAFGLLTTPFAAGGLALGVKGAIVAKRRPEIGGYALAICSLLLNASWLLLTALPFCAFFFEWLRE